MIQRKKSLRDYSRDKKLREGKPLYAARQTLGVGSKSATGRPRRDQDEKQATKRPRATLKRVSAKRAKENREYTERRRLFLLDHPWCEVNPLEPATDVHHRDGREGSLLNREELWMAVSRRSHDWIHQHPNEARNRGWLV